MDRVTRKRLQSQAANAEVKLLQATRLRMAQQVNSIAEPAHPATGTDRVSALLADARRREDEAMAAARRAAAPTPVRGMRAAT